MTARTTLQAGDGGWPGRHTLGGLGQRCGERIAQSYAAGPQLHSADPDTSGSFQMEYSHTYEILWKRTRLI